MKKMISSLLMIVTTLKVFASLSVQPANLNGVNDTARCQHTYSKLFTASGGSSVYPSTFSVSSGTLPNGLKLDTISGVLSGRVSYTRDTNITFSILVRNNGASASRSYTLHIRNTILSRSQLNTIWSGSYPPAFYNVYDTWYNVALGGGSAGSRRFVSSDAANTLTNGFLIMNGGVTKWLITRPLETNNLQIANSAGTPLLTLTQSGVFTYSVTTLKVQGLPTSTVGLTSNMIWNDSGTLKIIP